MSKGYDERCWELAGYFLGGYPPEVDDKTHRDELAQAIQDAFENWFAGQNNSVEQRRGSA